jgi:hypothetical protein
MGYGKHSIPASSRGGRNGHNNQHKILQAAAEEDPEFDPPVSSRRTQDPDTAGRPRRTKSAARKAKTKGDTEPASTPPS